MKFVDLHLHTIFSDGTYSPQELVLEAQDCGLQAIAIADHDSVAGIDPALETAKDCEVEVIPAIELSSEYDNFEIHMLGYFIDYKSSKLIAGLDLLRKNRIARIHKMTEKLKAAGLKIEPESIFDISGDGTPGRMHVSRAMVKQGLVSCPAEAFEKYIGDRCPGYVCGFKLSPEEAIRLIQDSGGVAVLAHPYLLKRDELIPQFVGYGLKGLEVYYPEHTQSMVNFYLDLARQYGLAATGGSDFHGRAKPEIKMGAMKIPYTVVEELRKLKP